MAVFNAFIGLGPEVMMPIIFFILALCFKIKIGNAFKAGMMVGIGFTGLNLLIGALLTSLGPAVQEMITRFGLNFNVVDVGWAVGSSIAWSSSVVPGIIFGSLILNVVLVMLKLTKTIDIDIFNYWGTLMIGALAQFITGNMFVALAIALVFRVVLLKIADFTAPKLQEAYDMKGVSFTNHVSAPGVVIAVIVNKVIDAIPGIRNINLNLDKFTKRFGVLGDPVTIGSILGLGLGLLAGWNISDSIKLAVKVAAVMVLLPRMLDVLVEGLITVRDAAEITLKQKFPDREIYLGIDAGILISDPAILSTGLLLIPVALLLAVILPGNKMLPFVDLASAVFFLSMVGPFCKNNIFRIFITGIICVTIALYAGTMFAPYYTEAAKLANISMPEGVDGTYMSNLISSHSTFLGIIFTKIAELLKAFI
ncbi:MAG: PTS galactitol transporter subunit IIC [Clostridioides sp.]|jgi:PTS system galactitol-specific IIC component|nr:PTS galactitol transporter subunit IIC [Clostridioides sp.]